MQKKTRHLKTLKERKDNSRLSPIEISYRNIFKELLQDINIKEKNGVALSVSTGDGLSDYLVYSNSGGGY